MLSMSCLLMYATQIYHIDHFEASPSLVVLDSLVASASPSFLVSVPAVSVVVFVSSVLAASSVFLSSVLVVVESVVLVVLSAGWGYVGSTFFLSMPVT